MLPAEFELLLKVIAEPDEDEPRLVYADVLQERGDDRGEFIPLQCALAKPGCRADPERFAAMREREGELLAEHAEDWKEQAVPFNATAFFHRGFIEELECLPGDLLHRGLEVVAPIRVLQLRGDTTAEVAQRALALPLGSKIQELTLRLVDSDVDSSLRATGASLTALRQLSAEANTIELLSQLGWLQRLERLELPVGEQGAALIEDLAIFKPAQLEQLWLRPQGNHVGRDVLSAIILLWSELPAVLVRWRGADFGSSDPDALMDALSPYRQQVTRMASRPPPSSVEVLEGAALNVLPPTRLNFVVSDPFDDAAPGPPMELVELARPPPSTAPWDEGLSAEGFLSRGFLPRALPLAVTLLRAEEKGVPVLVALGPVGSRGAVPFAEDLARLMALPSAPDLVRVRRTSMLESSRWASFESFEGVSLWELMQLHRRLSPGVALRVLGQAARAASKIKYWQPSTDDVLLDVRGQVRLLPGFPGSLRSEEPSYTGGEEHHPLGVPPEDAEAPGARVMQLGTALFELLTGTTLFDESRRSEVVTAGDWRQLSRQLERDGLSLASVDPALAVFEPLVARALSHIHAERFEGHAAFADALEGHPQAAKAEEVAQMVRAALPKLPRTRDGR